MRNSDRYKTARTATVVSAISNTALAVFKVIVGIFARSHALLADGLHSFSDLITDGLVFFAARAGHRVPDVEHPYGHQRIETIATIIISLILIMVGLGIIYDSYQHFIHSALAKMTEIPVLIASGVSIITNEWLYRYTLKLGKESHSTLLVSNALHHRSDAWISGLVILGAIGALLGFGYLDLIAAMIIAMLILKMGFEMIWTAIKELIDTGVDKETLKQIEDIIKNVSGVVSIHQLRTRYHGGNIFVDVHVLVNSHISVSEGHHIGERVHVMLMKKMPIIADVVVHIDPEDDRVVKPSEHLPGRLETEALLKKYWQQLPGFDKIQKITLHYLNGKLYIELFMPEEVLQIKSCQKLAEEYRNAVCDVEDVATVTIHTRCMH